MDILLEIIARKRQRVEAAKDLVSLEEMFAKATKTRIRATPHALLGRLINSEEINVIAEFKRSGSALVSHATAGIKAQKENIQLLGAHAQSVVSSQPVFYFIPAKQEADGGVNAGDLILSRLEEKSERRQFEIAAHGAWRSGSGISLTRLGIRQ